MPQHSDAFISDVVIVIDDEHFPFEQMVETLQFHGVSVNSLRPDQHIVEGHVESSKLSEIDDLPGVNYLRAIFTYCADFPVGHALDKDEVNRPHYPDETSPSYRRGGGYRKI